MGPRWLTGPGRSCTFAAVGAVRRTEGPRPRGDLARWLSRSTVYLYLVPALAVYGLFFLRPLVDLVRLSFVEWDGIGPKTFVGTDNYTALLHDSAFWQALRHNAAWMLAGIVVPTVVALVAAIVLVRSAIHGRT